MNIIYGAGVIGEAVLYSCRDKGIHIDCFCDDDPNKIGKSLMGLPIIATPITDTDHYIIATINISNIANKLINYTNNANYMDSDCISFLQDYNIAGKLFSKPNKYVQHMVDLCVDAHKAYQQRSLYLKTLDLVITERCSLRCKDCSNLMQYYDNPKHIPINILYNSIDRLCELVDGIGEVRIIGGEPLVNPVNHFITRYVASKSNIKKVTIYTNGTIKLSKDQLDLYQHEKIFFFITNYGKLSKNIGLLTQQLDTVNIPYYVHQVGAWTNCSDITNHTNGNNLYKQCCMTASYTLLYSALYKCPFSAHAINLNLIPNYTSDKRCLIDKSSLKQFIQQDYLSSCNHCNGRTKNSIEILPAIQKKILCQK
jgi:hypothetical protein